MLSAVSLNQEIAGKAAHDFVGKPKPDGIVLVVGPSSSALVTARNLEAMGFTADVVHSFSSALDLLKEDSLQHIPDLILVELNLASQLPDALRFPAAVKNQTIWGKIPIIARSPIRDADTILKVLKAGYCDYVICPTDRETLRERISRVFIQSAEIEKLTFPLPVKTNGLLSLEIELSAVNEFGAEALSQNFLAPGTVFNLRSEFFQRFHLKEIPVKVINCQEHRNGDWKYKLALGFVGTTPAFQQRLRRFAISRGKSLLN